MSRQANRERLQEIDDYVDTHPGVKPAEIAKGLNLSRSAVTRALPALEEEGILLAEDQQGRLWQFRR